METLISEVVLVLIFLSLPATIAWLFLSTPLERICAGGYGWAGCALRYAIQGLGMPVAVVVLVLACLMLFTIEGGPAWIWPFFFGGIFYCLGIGWVSAWIAVGFWFVVRNLFRSSDSRESNNENLDGFAQQFHQPGHADACRLCGTLGRR